jgi:hypothetical protein
LPLPPCALPPSVPRASRFSLAAPLPIDVNRSADPLVRFGPLQGSLRSPCPRPFHGDASPRVLSPLQHRRSHRLHPRASTLEVRPRPRFGYRLREHSSGKSFPGLFHPGSAPGVLPSGVCSSNGAPKARRLRDPLLSFPAVATMAWLGCLGLPVAQAWADFRVLPSVRIRAPVRCSLERQRGRSPPGLPPP